MHRYILRNDDIQDATQATASPGQVGLMNGWGVFSTIRVTRGVLFAFERHFARMQKDAELMRVPFPRGPEWMEEHLLKLVRANDCPEATLRVVVVRNKGGLFDFPGVEREFDVMAFTKDMANWSDGARLGVVPQARHAESRFAGTKVMSWSHNLTWLEEARERGFDEVVLLNERDEVSECTSANIFIANGNDVWTPPLNSGCLPGVTRAILVEEIRVPGIRLGEKPIQLRDLESADEVFITSTTRDTLPVAEIEGLTIHRSGKVRDAVQAAFSRYLENYVDAKASRQKCSIYY